MYAPHEHAQHFYHCVLSLACPGFLTVPQGGMSAPPAISRKSRRLPEQVCACILASDGRELFAMGIWGFGEAALR
jgi:hypothetical protein